MHRARQWMRSAFVAPAIAAACGCAGVQPPRPAGPPGTARVGWVIMSGDRDTPDHDFVCQSVQPPGECVVPLSRADAQVFAHVHVYYHPAATEMKYTGSVQIGFFEGTGGANTVHPDLSVRPGGSPGNQSVVGIVRSQPGTYSLSIAVVATSTQTGASQEIRDLVSVTVR